MEQQRSKLEELDRNMRMNATDGDGVHWWSPREKPFRLLGFPWFGKDGVYRRMPLHPGEPLPQAVDWLANCTAGGQIRFDTDAQEIHIRVKLRSGSDMYHMAPTGQCGFDCYVGGPGAMLFAGTAALRPGEAEYTSRLAAFASRERRSITLYFPLYQGVEEVWVGTDNEALIWEPAPFRNVRPLLIYGTSITQGGCASRPGMAYTNILGRSLNMEVVNLGFSGNGRGEPEVARTIATIPDPACLVLDYEANCDGLERLRETLPAFIRLYRERHKEVPIVVVTRIRAPKAEWDPVYREAMLARRSYQLGLVEEQRAAGDQLLFAIDGYELLGEDYGDTTVDGTHPTDLGFYRIAKGLLPILQEVLSVSPN